MSLLVQDKVNIQVINEEVASRIIVEEKMAQEEQQRKEQELVSYRKILMGWGDAMTPLRLHKVMATLGSLVKENGKIMTRHEFVKRKLRAGWIPYKVENKIEGKGNLGSSKVRTEYQIRKDKISYKVTKTEYDFAVYLIETRKMLKHK